MARSLKQIDDEIFQISAEMFDQYAPPSEERMVQLRAQLAELQAEKSAVTELLQGDSRKALGGFFLKSTTGKFKKR